VALVIVLGAGMACVDQRAAGGSGRSAPGAGTTLTILVAASARDALAAARDAYVAARPDVSLRMSNGSSAALATQILEGAPADVFLSADASNAARIVDAGLSDGPTVVYAANELAIVTPAGSSTVSTPADLGRSGVQVIAAAEAVPISGYATRLVKALATLPGYPSGFEGRYRSNVVSREEDVRAVVAKIALGEGDAAIPIPDPAQVRAEYAGVVLRRSEHPEPSHAFLDWLRGRDGQAVLRRFGFLPPP
jgi:molybdate transport system substrate-binding protein